MVTVLDADFDDDGDAFCSSTSEFKNALWKQHLMHLMRQHTIHFAFENSCFARAQKHLQCQFQNVTKN